MAGSQPNLQPDCASDLALDQLLGDELELSAEQALRTHLEDCARCRERLAEMRRFRDGVAVPPLPSSTTSQVAPFHPRRPWVTPGLATLAIAASIGFVINHDWRQPGRVDGDLALSRSKGSGRLGFYVKRGEQIQKGAPADILHPGDNIEFVYRAPSAGYLAIFSVDGRGKASVYYPISPVAAPVQAGEQVLPQSTLLDDALGPERIFSMFCTRAERLEPIRVALETGNAAPPVVSGCTVETLYFEKR